MLKSRFLKRHHYILIGILLVGFYIRTRPIRNLTGGLTGLDPYLFLRYANWIEKYGYLPSVDYYKYFPLGIDTRRLMWFLAFTIRFFGMVFGSNYLGAILYSPIMFFLGSFVLALAIKEVWSEKEAYLFALFISFLPAFLFRVSSGFSDKEPLAYFFLSLSIYFTVRYFKYKEDWSAFYSGLFLGMMAISWGGYQFLLASYSLAILYSFWRKEVRKFVYISSIPFLYIILFLTIRYPIKSLLKSYYGMLFFASFGVSILYEILERLKIKISLKISRFIIDERILLVFLVFIAGIAMFGGTLVRIINYVFITPYGGNRFALSVSENQPPYFNNWIGSLSYLFIPFIIFLPLFFYEVFRDKRISLILWVSYIFLILSRFSPQTPELNQIFSNTYWIPLMLSLILPFLRKEDYDFNLLVFFSFLILSSIGTRTAMRIFFVIAIPFSIALSRVVTKLYEILGREEMEITRYLWIGAVIVLALYSGYITYLQSLGIFPTISPIWIQTYSWIENNTSIYDIISHWWDYGYWVQYYSDRFTSVDGGNSYYVRNFYNARYFFTGENARDFLKAMEVLGFPDYILITSREPFVFYQIARIGYRDTWLGTFQPAKVVGNNTILFSPITPAPIHYDLTKNGMVFPGNLSYLQTVIKKGERYEGVVVFPEGGYYSTFNISCVCKKTNCTKMEGELKGCIEEYEDFVFYLPRKTLNYTFIKTYIMDGGLSWMKKVYDNEIVIPFKDKLIVLRDLSLLNLRNERVPDLKVYRIDYKELKRYLEKA